MSSVALDVARVMPQRLAGGIIVGFLTHALIRATDS
jgi:hypothetical protein